MKRRVFDVSNPRDAEIEGEVDTPGSAQGMAVSGNCAYTVPSFCAMLAAVRVGSISAVRDPGPRTYFTSLLRISNTAPANAPAVKTSRYATLAQA